MNSYLKKVIFTNSLFFFADGLIIPLYALFVTQIGGNAELAGMLFGTKYVASSISELLVMRIKDRENLSEKLVQINYLLRGLSWSSLIFFPTIPMLFIASVGIGISESIGSPAFNALMSEHLDKKKHTREWAIYNMSANLLIAAASIASGFIYSQFGFQLLFALMTFLALVSFLILRFKKTH